ncbi:hypothetical protein [Aureispira sp. CCB-E]|uniref:hypothetical protein n=1 Tax=Aureispira sp. CCB-E TaxID=3051121 RepID=UPI002868F697|nr:hypothetical protein [Aureispira sp. CCB-E]WMX13607.1 hypothetical protein QP953_22405 [Aureispira sp. CCB-E]
MNRITIFKLYELIGSLKKEEKRSFKLFSKKYRLDNDSGTYLKVFDYLDKQETLDRKKFKQKFQQVKGLSGIQTYLYQQILKSLRNQQAYKNVDVELMEGLIELEILFSKNLLNTALEKLLELQYIAERQQRILILPLIYEWWFKLQNTRFRYDNVEQADLEKYEQKYADIFSITKEYADCRIQLGRIIYSSKLKFSRQLPTLVQEISDCLPVYKPYQQQSVPGEVAALQLRAYLAAVARDTKSAAKYHQYLYDFTKELPPLLFQEYKRIHFTALGGVIVNSTDWKTIVVLLEDYNNISPENQKYITFYVRLSIASTQLKGYLSTGLFKESQEYIKSLPPSSTYPNQTISTFLHYQFALSHYSNKDYDVALKVIDEILNDKQATKPTNYSSLLRIIILYEQEEYILLGSYLNNVRRNFKKKDVLFDFDKKFISLINKLISLPQQEHIGELIRFRAKLLSFLREHSSLQREFLLYFNFLGWLDWQIDKKEFKKLCYWGVDGEEWDEEFREMA